MNRKRLWQTIRMCLKLGSSDRVEYLKKNNIFGYIGQNVTIMDRKIPLYARLIRIHDNVRIASNVTFATHDITHFMLNKLYEDNNEKFLETIGCIEIMDNVFVGTNSTIIGGVRIGPNAIIAGGSVVTKDVEPNTVVGGVPARFICGFDEYLANRKIMYPAGKQPKGQEVSDELVEFMWNKFDGDRKEK